MGNPAEVQALTMQCRELEVAASIVRREREREGARALLHTGAMVGAGTTVSTLTAGTGVPAFLSYLAGAGTVSGLSIGLDSEVRDSLGAGDWAGAMAHGSYHLPFVGTGRSSWDAWHAGKPWGAAGHASLFGLEALGLRGVGKVRWGGGVGRHTKSAYAIAKTPGAKHHKMYVQYRTKPANQLRKGIRSYQRRIEEHRDKLANPQKYYPDWDTLTPDHRKSALQDWRNEVVLFSEQRDIFRGILQEQK